MTTLAPGIEFELPDELAAREPPETRGLSRDSVRLMVSRVSDDEIIHTTFTRLPEFLARGDVLVVNTSATINAALEAVREARDGTRTGVLLHLSTPLTGSRWVVELRRTSLKGSSPLLDAEADEVVRLPAGGIATLIEPYAHGGLPLHGVRLWVAELSLPTDPLTYTALHGSPIRYAYVPRNWPLSYYQTVFAAQPGSAEMPSAGRPFTREMLHRLERAGVRIARVTLHTGVSSLDSDEPPYPERYRVSASTARAVNEARAAGGRVVAVGTTVVRTLETAASADGEIRASQGWTDLVISPEQGLRSVDALLTGFHAPKASHLSMLEAFAGADHLHRAYGGALSNGYLWHEFGDLHLVVPS